MRAWRTHVSYQDNGPCRNCGWLPAEVPGGRCRNCADYLRRTGKERPPQVILRHMKRLADGDKRLESPSSARSHLMQHVDVLSHKPCWWWTGGHSDQGYGLMRVDGVTALAHRVAYMLHHGPISPDQVIDHVCGHKRCVNPSHLEAVSQSENMRRARQIVH